MTLRERFLAWCKVHGYFPNQSVYVRDETPLHPQCARLVRLHSPIDVAAGHDQHWILEARFGPTEIRYPLGQERRDLHEMMKRFDVALGFPLNEIQ